MKDFFQVPFENINQSDCKSICMLEANKINGPTVLQRDQLLKIN